MPECQQTSSSFACYASGPNDVWSLGVVLVNLTCGRNPWKRASIDDSTFRAYLKNPRFLSSILPLSPELDSILRRIFECDPRRRISIPELRNLILRCPRFTTYPAMFPSSPPHEVDYIQESTFEPISDAVNPFQHYPTLPYTPVSSPPIRRMIAQHSHLTTTSTGSSPSDDGSVFSASSSCSTSSSCSEHEDNAKTQRPECVLSQLPGNFYGQIFPNTGQSPKTMVPEPFIHSVQVY